MKVRTAPDVEAPLWDRVGRVLAILPDEKVVVELGEGAEALFLPDQLLPGPNASEAEPSPFDTFYWFT